MKSHHRHTRTDVCQKRQQIRQIECAYMNACSISGTWTPLKFAAWSYTICRRTKIKSICICVCSLLTLVSWCADNITLVWDVELRVFFPVIVIFFISRTIYTNEKCSMMAIVNVETTTNTITSAGHIALDTWAEFASSWGSVSWSILCVPAYSDADLGCVAVKSYRNTYLW